MQSSEKKWPVRSLSIWNNSSKTWEARQYKEGCCCLLIKETLMLLIETMDAVTTAVESVNLCGTGGEVKAIYLDENIGFSVTKSQGSLVRFFKIRLANTLEKNALNNCIEVVDELRKFIIVTDHPKHTGKKSKVAVKKPLQQLMSKVLNSNRSVFKESELVSPNESNKEALQQFILDPDCLALVAKADEILKNILE